MIIDSCNTFFPLSYAYILILLPIWGGEIKKKKCPAARETRHEEILIQRNVTQTEMLMKSDNIKRCTYMYIALLFRQLASIRTKIVNPRHCTVDAKKTQFTWWSIAPKVAESVQVCIMLKKWNKLPITFKNFVIIDPCNAFFSLSCAYILIQLTIHIHQ